MGLKTVIVLCLLCGVYSDGNEKQLKCDIMDLGIMLDASKTVGRKNFNKTINFAKELVSRLNIGINETRVSAMIFSRKSLFLSYFNQAQNQQVLIRMLDGAKYIGKNKRFAQALNYGLNEMFSRKSGFRKSAPNIELIFTDGKWNKNMKRRIDRFKKRKIRVIFVAIGNNPNMMKINDLAPPHHVFSLDDFDRVLDMIKNSSAERCTQKPKCPNNQVYSDCAGCDQTCEQRGQRLACTLQCRQKCTCPGDMYLHDGTCYNATDCPVGIKENLDLMFLIDNSGSIRQANFQRLKSFLKTFAENFNLSRNFTRIGIVSYSYYDPTRDLQNQPYIKTVIQLGEFTTQSSFKKAVDKIQYQGYTTFTAAGLRKVALDFQDSDRFNDNSTKKVLILITDGLSSDADKLLESATQVRDLGVKILSVGVGRHVFVNELRIIATGSKTSNDQVFGAPSYNNLGTISDDLIEAVVA